MKKVKLLITVLFAVFPLLMHAGDFTVGNKTFLLNGEPFVVKAAEVHYPRIPQAYWDHRIKMCKALGMNTLCIYVFWNIHEQREGQFDFSGNNDVAEFCSSFVLVHTCVQSGRWADCPGGCSRRRIYACESRIHTLWSE